TRLGLCIAALVGERPGHTDGRAVDDREGGARGGGDRYRAAGGVRPQRVEDRGGRRAAGAATRARAEGAGGMLAAKCPARDPDRADGVLEEPEAGGGGAAVVEASHAGVEEHVPERGTGRDGVQVGGGEDVLDVVF